MEALEIILYIVVAIVVGIILFQGIKQTDHNQTYEDIQNTIQGEQDLFRVDLIGLVKKSLEVWQKCQFGEGVASEILYYTGENITRAAFFDEVKRTNNCDILSSATAACGQTEHIAAFAVEQDQVIEISCHDHQLYIE